MGAWLRSDTCLRQAPETAPKQMFAFSDQDSIGETGNLLAGPAAGPKGTGFDRAFASSKVNYLDAVQIRAPPVASIIWPVVQRASFDARKAMTSATSSAFPTRENTESASAPARASGNASHSAFISVSVTPGSTALTVIPRAANSGASANVKVSRAPLEAA